jgi:hypothetical protein
MKSFKSVLDMVNMPRYFDGGSRVSPKIALREVVVNSLEAHATQIVINAIRTNDTPKVFIQDNGDSMTTQEQVDYLTHVGASGLDKSEVENFGQGARLSTLGRNREGVIWTSTKDGITSETTVSFVPKSKRGEAHYASVTKSWKAKDEPKGTEVLFLGNTEDEELPHDEVD